MIIKGRNKKAHKFLICQFSTGFKNKIIYLHNNEFNEVNE